MKNKWTRGKLKWLRKNYAKYGNAESSKKLGLSVNCIKNKAIYENLKTSASTKKKIEQKRIQTIQKINTKNKIKNFVKFTDPHFIYFLGLMWADGYLYCKKNLIGIQLNEKDFKDLEHIFLKIAHWNKCERPARGLAGKSIVIHFRSQEICDFFVSYDYHIKSGASPDKILKRIPNRLKMYFFRGYLDGDGNIGVVPKQNYTVNFTSCYQQNWKFIKLLCKKLNLKCYVYKRIVKMGKSSSCRISKKDSCIRLLDFIYSNYDKIGLDRKYKKYQLMKLYITK